MAPRPPLRDDEPDFEGFVSAFAPLLLVLVVLAIASVVLR